MIIKPTCTLCSWIEIGVRGEGMYTPIQSVRVFEQIAEQIEKEIAAMREAVKVMDESLNDANAFIAADNNFHEALAQATQNTLILILVNSIVNLLSEQRKQIFETEGGPQRGQIHHKRILESVIRRDPEAARAAMHTHLRQVREDVGASTENKG